MKSKRCACCGEIYSLKFFFKCNFSNDGCSNFCTFCKRHRHSEVVDIQAEIKRKQDVSNYRNGGCIKKNARVKNSVLMCEDWYVKQRLRKGLDIPLDLITDEMITHKREQLLLSRELKQFKEVLKNGTTGN